MVVVSGRYLLAPRSSWAYGQDILQAASATPLGLQVVLADDLAGYVFDEKHASLVVSHNVDDAAALDVVTRLPSGCRVCVHVHTQWSYMSEAGRSIAAQLLGKATSAITPTVFMTTAMQSRFPRIAWQTIRNGVDAGRFRPCDSTERRAFRESLSVPAGALVLCYVGRLENAKGLQVLESLAGVLDSNTWLWIQYPAWSAKADAYRVKAEAIARRAPARVVILPDTDPTTARPIRFADVAVHPSLSELAPLAVIEAWMSGIPAVLTRCTEFYREVAELEPAMSLIDVPRPGEILLSERTTLTLSLSEADSLADAVLTAARSMPGEDLREWIAGAARIAGFSPERMVESFERAYS